MQEPKNPVDRFFYYLIRSAFLKTFLLVVLIGGVLLLIFARPILNYLQAVGMEEQVAHVENIVYGTPTSTRYTTMTYTHSPSFTATPNWHWAFMDKPSVMIFVPDDWDIYYDNYAEIPGDPNPCIDYIYVGPEMIGKVTIKFWCGAIGGAGSLWNLCPKGAEIIDAAKMAVRYWQDGTIYYVNGSWDDNANLVCSSYGWLDLDRILEVTYFAQDGVYDFETVDKMLLSVYFYD